MRLKVLFSIVMLLLASLAFGQDPGIGTPAFNTFSHAGGGIDTINLGNLNIHVDLPLRSLGAYGPTASAGLVFDNNVSPVLNSSFVKKFVAPVGFIFTNSTSNVVQRKTKTGSTCSPPLNTIYKATAQGVVDANNTFHDTPLVSLQGCNVSGTSGPGSDGWSIVGSLNAAGAESWYAVAPNGDSTICTSGSVCSGITTDPHQNSVSSTLYMRVNATGGVYGEGVLKDALGNTVLQAAQPTPGSTIKLTYPAPGPSTATYTLTFTKVSQLEAWGCPYDQTNSSPNWLMNSISYPDLSTVDFTYEPVYNNGALTTGRIASVKLRTGAKIIYDYTGYGTHGINCYDGSTAGFTKFTPDGTWTFTHTAPSGANMFSITTVKSPSGDGQTYTFSGLYPTSYDNGITGYNICYNGNKSTGGGCNTPPTVPTLPITERDVYTYIAGTGSDPLTVYKYDTYGRTTDITTYDFGGMVNGFNFASNELFTYGTNVPNVGCSTAHVQVNGISVEATGLVCQHFVTTASNVLVSSRLDTYATNTTDLITENDLINGAYQATTHTYDSFGRLTETDGPNGEVSTVAYGQCSGNMPSVFTSKANGSVNLTQTVTSTDCIGELPLHTLDANSNGTTISYTGDPFWRPKTITDAAGTVTTLSYTATTNDTRVLVTPSAVKESLTTLDSMGRVHVQQQRISPSSTNYNSVETDYNSDGLVSRVTTPYVSTAGALNSSIVSTHHTYDGIGRPLSITSPNGAVKLFSYNTGTSGKDAGGPAMDTRVTLSPAPSGENEKTIQYEYNGLGLVTSVCEFTPSMPTNSLCGQVADAKGFMTDYNYSSSGNLLSIIQNVGGASTQTRSFTYENQNTGRLLTATTPEAGTVHLAYDLDGTCGTFIGSVVKSVDNGGGTTCVHYDLLGRITSKTYSGLNSGATPSQTFTYDNSINGNIVCPSGKDNQLGRLAEVSTGGTDEGFCYDVVGNPTDYFQNDGSAWTHSIESYFPTGIPKTLAVATQPTITYGLNSQALVYTAAASGTGQDPLKNTNYNVSGLPTMVTLGSGDVATYGWSQNIGPMSSAVFYVGAGKSTNTLTYNANGTLRKVITTDTLNTANSQTCTYSYDDLERIKTDDCGSTWNQTFSYDSFGNISKTGNVAWNPGYNQTNNHYLEADTTYDANGRVTEDPFDATLAWDIEGNMVTQSGTTFVYDGLGRTASSTISGVKTNYFYSPDGKLMGTVDNSGAIQKMFVPLPMAIAVYNNGVLQQYRFKDWQGSTRTASTPSRTLFSSTAYAAFGEPYAAKGTTNNQYAGLTSDISSGTEQVSASRRYHPSQGRWVSPDGSIPDLFNPQTFNAYHYASNSPTNSIDPSGNDATGGNYVALVNITGESQSGAVDAVDQEQAVALANLDGLIGLDINSNNGTFSDISLGETSGSSSVNGVISGSIGPAFVGNGGYFEGVTNLNQVGNGIANFINDFGDEKVGFGQIGSALMGGMAGEAIGLGGEAAAALSRAGRASEYNFWNVLDTMTVGEQLPFSELPTRPPDRISPGAIGGGPATNKSGEPIYTLYWSEPGSMIRYGNHVGGMGTCQWGFCGPGGITSPYDFQMYYGPKSSWPVVRIHYDKMWPIK